MTAKGHKLKTLHLLYGQVGIVVKSDGRAIDGHAGRVAAMLMEDLLAGCRRKRAERKFIYS